ncbi:DUF885 domain-containing protein [Lentzea alba]|uniref:DUF885 domain-containing protein n=1 Tax=Lentzea alba TaxID=2714351 RepID=UPI0039BF315D
MSEVNVLADRLFAELLDHYPVMATLLGLDGDHEALTDHSVEAEQQFRVRLWAIVEAANELEPQTLSERITQGIALHEARSQADAIDSRHNEYLISANFRAPVPDLLNFLPKLPVDTPERQAAYLERLRKIEGFLKPFVERYRTSIENGRTPVALLVEQAIALVDRNLADLDAFDVVDGAREVIDTVVKPALENYRNVLQQEVLPHGRDTEHAGLCWMPEGDAIYRKAMRAHTTVDVEPAELHAIGLRQIEDLKREFAQYGEDVFDRLRNDPALRHTDGQDLLDAARVAVAKAEAEAPKWFRVMPEQKCAIEAMAPSLSAQVPPHYFPAAEDGSRPGTYFVNTKEPESRTWIEDEATAYHEAVPGHHFERAKGALLKDLPLLRRKVQISAFGEGWALYCERLADEMGLYSSDEARLGMLMLDAMRAGRLVVDTGLHALGWSRQQAIDYLVENTPMALLLIESEVDRYLGEPGQALAYMVGRLKFDELRARAEAAGKDVRDFHEVVLSQGRLTLALLDEVVTDWLAES